MFWSVCRKVVWFPGLLHWKKVFFQFAASQPDFPLIQKNVFACVSVSYAIPEFYFWEEPLLFFREETTHLTLYIAEKMFWFVGN